MQAKAVSGLKKGFKPKTIKGFSAIKKFQALQTIKIWLTNDIFISNISSNIAVPRFYII